MSGYGPYYAKPPNHMDLATNAVAWCGPFLGGVALNYAKYVDQLYYAGDIERSYYCSYKARQWCMISFSVVGTFVGLVLLGVIACVIAGVVNAS